MSICEKHNVVPFEAMIVAALELTEPKDRVYAWESVCQYVYPKRKAIEHTSDTQTPAEEKLDSLLDKINELTTKEISRKPTS